MKIYARQGRRQARPPLAWTAALVCLIALPFAASAHHAGHRLSIPSPSCGWIDGEDVLDRRNLADFCARWMPEDLGIRSASAERERLWVEPSPEFADSLKEDDRTTAAVLSRWLESWRKATGYTTASVILVRHHIEFARIQTTAKGDVVIIR